MVLLLIAIDFTVLAQSEDQILQTRIQTLLDSIPEFQGMEVMVTQGVVTLSGQALNAAIRDEAENLLASLEGVVYVVNSLELETSVEKTLSPAVRKLRNYSDNVVAFLPLLGIALLILLLFWFLARLLSQWQLPYRYFRVNPLLQTFIRQLVRLGIFVIGLLIALDILGATPFVTAILGTAGVVGLAVGFAFKDIVENYLAGILMSLRQPFASDDFLELAGFQGRVIRLTARELVLLTLEGNQVRIPNATVFNSALTNYTRNPRRRFSFVVGVDVDEDLKNVQALGKSTLSAIKGVLNDPEPSLLIKELGDFNVLIECFGWIDQREADFAKVKSQAIRLVKEAFDQAGILMPEPITNIRLKQISPSERLTQEDKPTAKQLDPSLKAEAETVDVSPGHELEHQIKEEHEQSDEENLLKPQTT